MDIPRVGRLPGLSPEENGTIFAGLLRMDDKMVERLFQISNDAILGATLRSMFVPSAFGGHWSLIILNLLEKHVVFLNTLVGIHGRSKLASKMILSFLNKKHRGDKKVDDPGHFYRFLSQLVPLQRDSTSCGWRVIANAYRFLKMKSTMSTLDMDVYPEEWLWWVREKCIHLILQKSIFPEDPDSPPKKYNAKKEKKVKKGMPFYSPFRFTGKKSRTFEYTISPGKEASSSPKGKSRSPKGMPVMSPFKVHSTPKKSPKKSPEQSPLPRKSPQKSPKEGSAESPLPRKSPLKSPKEGSAESPLPRKSPQKSPKEGSAESPKVKRHVHFEE